VRQVQDCAPEGRRADPLQQSEAQATPGLTKIANCRLQVADFRRAFLGLFRGGIVQISESVDEFRDCDCLKFAIRNSQFAIQEGYFG
jgi:hypothetical protein